jgi:hypothetical protein
MNITRIKNLRALLLIIILIISSSVVTFGQKTIIGKVYNENTKETISYANIGVVNSNVGTISNLDGSFSIIIPNNLSNDSLTFSSLGYNRKVVSLRQLASGKEYPISLTEKTTLLQTILVTAKKLKVRTIKLGNKNCDSGNYEPDTVYAGRAVALLIDTKTLLNLSTFPAYIKNAKLYIYSNNFNIFKFRIRLNKYDSLTGKPGEDLLEKSIVEESSIKEGWLTFDLSQFNLQVKGPFFITFEQLLDLDDRKAIANGYQRIQIFHSEWLVTDTIVFEGKKQINKRLETNGNLLSVPGTFIGTSYPKRVNERNSCFVRTTSLGEWKKAPMVIAGTVTVSR